MSISTVTPVELYNLSVEAAGGLPVVDVREPDEYAAVRASIGMNLPLSALSRGELGPLAQMPPDEPVYLLCRSGQRSMKACMLLKSRGFRQVINVTGGMLAWQAAGLPIVE